MKSIEQTSFCSKCCSISKDFISGTIDMSDALPHIFSWQFLASSRDWPEGNSSNKMLCHLPHWIKNWLLLSNHLHMKGKGRLVLILNISGMYSKQTPGSRFRQRLAGPDMVFCGSIPAPLHGPLALLGGGTNTRTTLVSEGCAYDWWAHLWHRCPA